jgi:serine/threonine protein kinase
LAAVHKQKLVHRDIKPSNIMVSVEEESTVTAKIIDLGLGQTRTRRAYVPCAPFLGHPRLARFVAFRKTDSAGYVYSGLGSSSIPIVQ